MNERPAYFDRIRLEAAQQWEQLERNPKLAGPWRQMFGQVQNQPRQVLSELLQNADDANATKASVRIENGVFVFEHNGDDFAPDHLESLCSFGYSNKQKLHNIGFRGIGFKSTFSLGDRVEIFTPTISIAFNRNRFTEPEWIELLPEMKDSEDTSKYPGHIDLTKSPRKGKITHIQVKINNRSRQRAVEENLKEWINNPISLLFFENIRCLVIEDKEIAWKDLGNGPIPASKRFALHGKAEHTLLIQSLPEKFPDDALEEIRKERTLDAEGEMTFPPCKVEIVLGEGNPSSQSRDALSVYESAALSAVKGRLFAVLPTAVKTTLPFACNAPFIQNPDRHAIKDPAMSPTNSWLLERIGDLAASAMLDWLGREELPLAERSRAYNLFPDRNMLEYSLDGACGKIVRDAFAKAIDGRGILLTESEQLVPKKQCIIVPSVILDVWSTDQLADLLDTGGRPAFCSIVEESARKRLLEWSVIEEFDQEALHDALLTRHPPRPARNKLLNLWAYLSSGNNYYFINKKYNIIPVQGKEELYAASEVIRLGDRKLLQSKDDWEFLAKHLLVMNPNWPRFLAEQRLAASGEGDPSAQRMVDGAYAVLRKIELDEASDANKAINQAAKKFFHEDPATKLADCVRLAQIAAKLGAGVDDRFLYVTRDLEYRSGREAVLFDKDGDLEGLLPEDRRKSQLLHNDYLKSFTSCSIDEWNEWIASGRARVRTFVPMVQMETYYYSKEKIEKEAVRRGLCEVFSYPYKKERFVVEDWDFEEDYWNYWMEEAANDETLWVKIAGLLLDQREVHWSNARSARFLQVTNNGSKKSLTASPIPPRWVLQLRDLPCLPDDEGGNPSRPVDLLRLTLKTKPVIDVEPFIDSRWDRETARPLLDLLGVRSMPTGPDHLLERLRALSTAEKPPAHEVEKWYKRLDMMIDSCSTADQQKIRHVLTSERLILSQDGAWATAPAIFVSGEEDVPGVAVIMTSVRELALWRKIGVNDRPTVDLVVSWLKTLQPETTPSQDEATRIRGLLVRYPLPIWTECGCWLNLTGKWSPVSVLSYSLTDQSHIQWKTLHPWVQKRTADLRHLQEEDVHKPAFSRLIPIEKCIKYRLKENIRAENRPMKGRWLRTLGTELRRFKLLDNQEDADSVRALANRLARTEWYVASELEIIPYIDDTPAGTARQGSAVWHDKGIYVDRNVPDAKLAHSVPEEIGRPFDRADIRAALYYSFERPGENIREYLSANFTLDEAAEALQEGTVSSSGHGFGTAIDQNSSDQWGEEPADVPIDDGGQDDNGAADSPRPPRGRRTRRPIMDDFAARHGFRRDGNTRFYNDSGSIQKLTDSRFRWFRYDINGTTVRYYLPIDRCLEREQLEIAADVWGMIKKYPDRYAIVLRDTNDVPKELDGSRLVSMLEKGQVIIHPATYRLEYKEQHSE